MIQNKDDKKEIITSFLAIVMVLALLFYGERFTGVLGIILGIIKPFILGGAIAYVLSLPMSFIERKLLFFMKGKRERLKRVFSILLSLVFVTLLVLLLLLTVIPEIARAIQNIGREVPIALERLGAFLEKHLSLSAGVIPDLSETIEDNWESFLSKLLPVLKSGIGTILSTTFSAAGVFVSSIASFFVSLIFAIYILGDKERLGRQLGTLKKAYLKEETNKRVDHFISILNKSFSSFITGQCMEAVILGSIFMVVLSILRMPYAVMIGVVVMFSALLPIVGAFIACFIGAFLILLESPVKALVFVIVFLVVQQLENNLIYPRVVGSSVGLPSIWVFFAVTIGGSLFGVVGMLIFIPLVSTLYILIKEDTEKRIIEKGA